MCFFLRNNLGRKEVELENTNQQSTDINNSSSTIKNRLKNKIVTERAKSSSNIKASKSIISNEKLGTNLIRKSTFNYYKDVRDRVRSTGSTNDEIAKRNVYYNSPNITRSDYLISKAKLDNYKEVRDRLRSSTNEEIAKRNDVYNNKPNVTRPDGLIHKKTFKYYKDAGDWMRVSKKWIESEWYETQTGKIKKLRCTTTPLDPETPPCPACAYLFYNEHSDCYELFESKEKHYHNFNYKTDISKINNKQLGITKADDVIYQKTFSYYREATSWIRSSRIWKESEWCDTDTYKILKLRCNFPNPVDSQIPPCPICAYLFYNEQSDCYEFFESKGKHIHNLNQITKITATTNVNDQLNNTQGDFRFDINKVNICTTTKEAVRRKIEEKKNSVIVNTKKVICSNNKTKNDQVNSIQDGYQFDMDLLQNNDEQIDR